MSKADEIRAKFRAKGAAIKAEMESPYGRFRSKFSTTLDKYCSNLDDSFMATIFEAYNETKPADIDAWIEQEIMPMFKSLGPAPSWRFEPDWAFVDNLPGVFVTRFDADDETFYVFQGARKTNDGLMRCTKISAQGDSYRSNMDGEIIG
ncbi:hypothetical protein RvVAR0630_13250 [Agrobacterium vitis]|uniref:hypothetical protein n=1 Tax=Agrobacterium vitis TaxID=373 RepID=UPI0015D87379|nr:hypothetical protein [Agrobacterium vitis]BCH58701.1 hypothetical protein RvVAR0630_13250 [Agrobacterium vitis]